MELFAVTDPSMFHQNYIIMQTTNQSASPQKFKGVYVFEPEKVYHLTAVELAHHMIRASEAAHRVAAEQILNSYSSNKIAVLEYIAGIGKK